jgi:homocitrate synthase NifV
MRPLIIDTTLRDGMQAPGAVFSRRERVTIARMLCDFGIDEIEAGVPVMGKSERDDIRAVVKLGLKCRLTVWCRADTTDIALAEQCGTGSVHISFPLSKILLATIGKNESWLFSACETLVSHAAKRFGFVSVGGQDATRADVRLVKKFARFAATCGAQRFRIADTVGVALPLEVAAMVRSLCGTGMPQVEFHGHNDFGMASANAVTALSAGAAAVSVTVNGLGERAGNAALEEVVMALRARSPKHVSRYDLKILPELCAFVARAAHRPLCKSKPIVGEGIFEHESGIHVDGLMRNPMSYQPFLPRDIGRTGFRTVVGYNSGASAVAQGLREAGIVVDRSEAARAVEAVRDAARKKKRALTAQELKKVFLNARPVRGKKRGNR